MQDLSFRQTETLSLYLTSCQSILENYNDLLDKPLIFLKINFLLSLLVLFVSVQAMLPFD